MIDQAADQLQAAQDGNNGKAPRNFTRNLVAKFKADHPNHLGEITQDTINNRMKKRAREAAKTTPANNLTPMPLGSSWSHSNCNCVDDAKEERRTAKEYNQ